MDEHASESSLDELQDATFRSATSATAGSYPAERRLAGEALERYLDRRVFGVLGTTRPDGRPHAAPVSYTRRGTSFWMPTTLGSVRARNVAGVPWGVLTVVEGDRTEHVAVIVEGPVSTVEPGAVPADVASFSTGDWISTWLLLEARRVLSYAAEGAHA